MNKALKIFLVFTITFAIGIVLWTALSETPPSNSETGAGNTAPRPTKANAGLNNSKFIGIWKLQDDNLSQSIYVHTDSTMMVDDGTGKMRNYTYKIVDDRVMVLDGSANMYMNQMLKLTADSLVFESFLNDTSASTYTR